MRISFTIVVFSFLLVQAIAQPASPTEHQKIHDAIRSCFDAFSDGSIEKLEQGVTTDVSILEDGVVWNLDTLRRFFKRPRPADFKRVNSFDYLQTEADGRMAFVSYYNIADIHANGKDFKVKWLESAVLVRDGDKWRIKMLHSTRVKN